jgi:hypothetical protein
MIYKCFSRRYLPLEKRDRLGLSCLERTKLRRLKERFQALVAVKKAFGAKGILKLRLQRELMISAVSIAQEFFEIVEVEEEVKKAKKPKPTRRTIQDFVNKGYNFGETFRFTSAEDLLLLLECFRLPKVVRVEGYVFSNEEVLLISLIRLSYPMRWSQVMMHFPGMQRWTLKAAFYWFLDFMIVNWGYLITNNREFWLDKLCESAEAIRMKLATLPNEAYRQHHLPADQPGGFNIALFIDNTMVAMSRPGGPREGGPQAPRTPLEVQQSWWTGWKKLHGLKWQTVYTAHGLHYEVPCSS